LRKSVAIIVTSVALAACSGTSLEVAETTSTTQVPATTSQAPDTTQYDEESGFTTTETEVKIEDTSSLLEPARSRFSTGSSEAGDARLLLTDQESWTGVFGTVLGSAVPVIEHQWYRYSEPAFYQDSLIGWRRDWRSSSGRLSERVFFLPTAEEAKYLAESQFSYWSGFATEHRGELFSSGLSGYSGFYLDLEPSNPDLPCAGVAVAALGRVVVLSEVNTGSCETTPAPWAETSVLNMLSRLRSVFPQ
jgi:hypothetical protein